ncbi:MAG: hypothetical protein WAK96_13915 [Desulfobaccales bacterium]
MDEYGFDFNWTPEPRKLITAVLPHPGHGRLVEKIILMINHTICFQGCFYTLSWRDGDVAFYQPAFIRAGCLH